MECELTDLFIPPGGSTTLDVYLANGTSSLVRGMQTGIAIAMIDGEGSSSIPCPCPCPPASHSNGGVRILDGRSDFIFFGQPGVISAVNCVTWRAVSSLLTGGVSLGNNRVHLSEYLITVDPDTIPGTQFQVQVLPPNGSLLVDSNNNPIPFSISNPCVFTVATLPSVTSVTVELVATLAPSSSSILAGLPASIESIPQQSTYYVEVWGQTNFPHGLQSMSIDLLFDAAISHAVNITPTTVFSEFRSGLIENLQGRIRDLSGSHTLVSPPCSDQLGFAPNWARLAIIEMVADNPGLQLLRATPATSPFLGTAICGQLGDVNPSNIAFGMTLVRVREETEIPTVSSWGVLALSLLLASAGTIMGMRRTFGVGS